MKTAVVLLAVVAVVQASLVSDILTGFKNEIAELKDLPGSKLREIFTTSNPDFKANYSISQLEANLKASVERMANNTNNFVKGITSQSGYSLEDFVKSLAARAPLNALNRKNSSAPEARRKRRATLPASVDWRTSGYVGPVKNQGSCGSCWTFSATGAMEGACFKKTNKLPNLSEQNLVDCVTASSGCNGGWMTDAYDYVKKNAGVDSQTSYPYTGKQGPSCKYNAANKAGTSSSYAYTAQNDETDLASKVATVGPIATAIDASGIQNYKSGIYSCANFTGLNHGVLIVGYGVENTSPYWIVKNSWGTTWGENGYIRIAKDKNNMCGIATAANYPVC